MEKVNIDSVIASTNPTWMIGGFKDDDYTEGPKGLPWRRCWCSRGDIDHDGDGFIETTRGSCAATTSNSTSNERCGRCGRANAAGNCDLGGCPGC